MKTGIVLATFLPLFLWGMDNQMITYHCPTGYQFKSNNSLDIPLRNLHNNTIALQQPHNAHVCLNAKILHPIMHDPMLEKKKYTLKKFTHIFNTVDYLEPSHVDIVRLAQNGLESYEEQLDEVTKRLCYRRLVTIKSIPFYLDVHIDTGSFMRVNNKNSLFNSFHNFAKEINIKIPGAHLRSIIIQNCPEIKHLSALYMQEIWQAFPQLQHFAMNNTNITCIPSQTLYGFPNGATADFSNNKKLKYIKPNMCKPELENAQLIFSDCPLTQKSITNIETIIHTTCLLKTAKNARATMWNTYLPHFLDKSFYISRLLGKPIIIGGACILAYVMYYAYCARASLSWSDAITGVPCLTGLLCTGTAGLICPLEKDPIAQCLNNYIGKPMGIGIAFMSFTGYNVMLWNWLYDKKPHWRVPFIPT